MSKVKNALSKIRKYVKENKKKARILMSITTVALILTVIGIANPNLYNKLLGNTAMINSGFEDEFFYSKVVEEYNKKNGTSKTVYDVLSDEELASISELRIIDSYDQYTVTSTKGIEKLTGLTVLELGSLEINNIDLSNNVQLVQLYLNQNRLESIDLSNNINLYSVSLIGNNIYPNKMFIGETYEFDFDKIKLPNSMNLVVTVNNYSNNSISYSNGSISALNSGNSIIEIKTDGSIIMYYSIPFSVIPFIKRDVTNDKYYYIDSNGKYIYTLFDKDLETIKEGLKAEKGELIIEDGKIKVLYNGSVLPGSEYTHIYYNINNYIPIPNEYIDDAFYTKADNIETAFNKISINNANKKIVNKRDNKYIGIFINSCSEQDIINSNCSRITGLSTVNVSSNNYDLNKKYIYLGSNELENDIDVVIAGNSVRDSIINPGEEEESYDILLEKMLDIDTDKVRLFFAEENPNCGSSYDSGSGYMSGSGSDSGSGGCSITFERTDYMIDSWDVIKVTSDDYEINGDTITLADKQTLDLNKINVTNADKVSLEVNNKKLIVKYEGNEVGSFNIVGGKVITTTSKKNEDSTIKSEVTTSSKTVSTTKKEEEKNIVEKIIDKIFKPTTTKNTENDNQTNVIKESTKKHTTTIEDKSTNVDEEDSQIASIKENTIVGIIVAFVIGVIVCLILIRYNKKQKSN